MKLTEHKKWTVLLLIAAGLLLFTGRGFCTEAAPERHAENHSMQVIYYDMIVAYQKGQFSEARKLARVHLQRFRDQMDNSKDERERESVVHGIVDVIYTMLDNEERLPDHLRFEGAMDLFDYSEEQMLHARDVFDSLSNPDDRGRAFIKDKLGKCSERWIRSVKAHVPRKRLDDHQKKFRAELESIGYTTVDNVLNKVKRNVQQIQTPPPVSDEDRGRIFDLIDAFYRGMISGDEKLVASVTGLDSKQAAALLEKYNSDLQQQGITKIISVTLPEMSDDNYMVRQSNGMANMYFAVVLGISMDVIHTDGTHGATVGDKLFSLKKEMSGTWTIELPEKK